MKIFKQWRKPDGKYKKKPKDIFLLWGEYPRGWAMIKDFMLCLFLVNALIGQLSKIDVVAMMVSETHVIVQDSVAKTAEAKEMPKEEKTPENEKNEKIGVFSAYNSDEAQTDGDPYTMASGKKVYDGAIANNCLAFGDKVVLNGKTYTVEDRMNSRYGCDHFDIWMEQYNDAIAFGRQTLSYEMGK